MRIELREASPRDYEKIVQLVPTEKDLFLVYPKGKHPFSVDQLQALAETRIELTVAVRDGEVLGFANLYDLKPGQWVFIGNVVIAHAHRGEGLGRKLVTHMTTLAFERYGVPEVRISVFSENQPALLLYSSLRFEPYTIEERRDPTGRRVALIHMKKARNEDE